MPTVTTSSVHKWKCWRCGAEEEVITDANVSSARLPKSFYKFGAKMSIDTIGRDFQGGIVGPGAMKTYDPKDVCDKCFSAFMKFWKDVDEDAGSVDRSWVTTEPAEKNTKGGYRGGKSASEVGPPSQV